MWKFYCRSCRSRFENSIWLGRCQCGSQKIKEIVHHTPLSGSVSEHHFDIEGEKTRQLIDKQGEHIRIAQTQFEKEIKNG